MGRVIKDGFHFMEYAGAHLIRKVDDIPALKHTLIALSETKTHLAISEYALLLGEHIVDFSGLARSAAVEECFAAIRRWQKKEAAFQPAREAAGVLNTLAREEKDPVKAKALRAMGQVAATPHVRWHALSASEYAVVVTNLICPGDMESVRREREMQISWMQSV